MKVIKIKKTDGHEALVEQNIERADKALDILEKSVMVLKKNKNITDEQLALELEAFSQKLIEYSKTFVREGQILLTTASKTIK